MHLHGRLLGWHSIAPAVSSFVSGPCKNRSVRRGVLQSRTKTGYMRARQLVIWQFERLSYWNVLDIPSLITVQIYSFSIQDIVSIWKELSVHHGSAKRLLWKSSRDLFKEVDMGGSRTSFRKPHFEKDIRFVEHSAVCSLFCRIRIEI